MSILKSRKYPGANPARRDTDLPLKVAQTLAALLMLSLLLLTPTNSSGITKTDKRKARSITRSISGSIARARSRPLTRAEMRAAEDRLAEMGYGTGPVDGVIDDLTRNALVAFQKWEERKVTGRMSREDFEVIMSADAPQAKDGGYRHVEVDLDRQVLLLTDDNGAVMRILPVSSGSNRQYREKTMSGLAYTPRGRFRIDAKISGWRKSPLGLLYYPNYFSGGLAIHGNPSVPQTPQSHGCIRIPMSAAVEMSGLLPLGTIVIVYDKQSFVSAKEWAKADLQAKTR
jgi:hypothetical protein